MASDLPPPPPAVHADVSSAIRLNTVGYLPTAPKAATVAASCDTFRVVRVSDGKTVFEGHAGKAFHTPASDTDEQVQIVDFTALSAPGEYRVEIPGVGMSDAFRVGAEVWDVPFQVVTEAIYLWRCGVAVDATWKGVRYHHDACHLEDGYLDYNGAKGEHRDGVGGWHDAGDYNKYVVNAGVSIGLMLKAWEQFGDRLKDVKLRIPENADAVPDLLNEIRFEAEWLLKMQADDGRVYHKLSATDFKYWGPAEKDHTRRYFTPWSTVATADFVAMMAEISRAWRPYDASFADRCLAAAKKSWQVLQKNPKPVEADLAAFHTGAYAPKDGSHRLWAAAELWETTGDRECLNEFETHAKSFSVSVDGPSWANVQDLAFATYLLSSRSGERNPALVEKLTASVKKTAKEIVATCEKSGYARPFGTDPKTWFWGCNGSVASQTFVLQLAHRLEPDPAYLATAQQALSFLFGRNYHARSYVTGLGARPPEHPHDRRGEPAWPGYLVGGGWPNGRSWEDKMAKYELNEIALNWNAALIYALAGFVEERNR